MIRIHSGFLVISARHLKLKNGVWWYQRRNPKDLREKFGLPVHVRKSLSTRDPSEAAVRARTLNATIEVGWGRLRAAPGQEATEVLAGQGKGSEEPLALQPSQEQQRLHDLLRASDGGVGSPPTPQGPPVGFARPEPLLSEALAIYLRQHPKGSDKRFAGNTRLAISKVTEAVGDMPLTEYTRQHANKSRDHMLMSLKTSSVRRRFDSISAVFKLAVDEGALKQRDGIRPLENPFSGMRIVGLGHDSVKREEFSLDELRALRDACRQLADERRLIIAMLMDTGARLGEIVGLRVADMFPDAPVPHIHIRRYEGRTLKTLSSERKVPLVGDALWAAQRALGTKSQDEFVFAAYGPLRANSASAALNKWIKERLGIAKTLHGLRHTMRTRLRMTNVPEEIQNKIGGWTDGNSVSRGYGSYPLELLREHLQRVVL